MVLLKELSQIGYISFTIRSLIIDLYKRGFIKVAVKKRQRITIIMGADFFLKIKIRNLYYKRNYMEI